MTDISNYKETKWTLPEDWKFGCYYEYTDKPTAFYLKHINITNWLKENHIDPLNLSDQDCELITMKYGDLLNEDNDILMMEFQFIPVKPVEYIKLKVTIVKDGVVIKDVLKDG